MSKRILLLGITSLMMAGPSFAQAVSEIDALKTATAFMSTSRRAPSRDKGKNNQESYELIKVGEKLSTDVPSYYLFGGEDGNGFVIVAGDERVSTPVLGYSYEGKVRADKIPDNLQYWLDCYSEQIAAMTEKSEVVKSAPKKYYRGNVIVEPLIKTQWNQEEPFNDKCPDDVNGRTVTGCVATALGQIINYHRWPQKSTGYVDYDGLAVWIEEDLGDYSYDYDNLDIPQLLYNVAVACRMEFSYYSSGAYDIVSATGLIRHFNYDKGMEMHSRDGSDYNTEWDQMLRDELDCGRPIYYTGQGKKGGHAFICDGYDDSNFFHFNWGWGGYGDGWFVTTIGNTSTISYPNNQTVFTHIQPDKGNGYWADIERTNWNNAGKFRTFAESVGFCYCLQNESDGTKYYSDVVFVERKGNEIDVNSNAGDYPDVRNQNIPDGVYRLFKVYQLPGDTLKTFPIDNPEAEMFRWADIIDGRMNVSSSRSFEAWIENLQYRFFILSDSTARIENSPENKDTLIYPSEVEYRNRVYSVKEVNSVSINSKKVRVFPDGLKKMRIECDGDEMDWSIPLVLPSQLESLVMKRYNGTELQLPQSLVHLHLESVPNINTLTIPSSVSSIGMYYVTPKSVVFEKGSHLSEIPEGFMADNRRLKEIVLPDNITRIKKSSFWSCANLKTVSIPASVEVIETSSFSFCTNLTSVYFEPESKLRELEDYSFSDCGRLENFDMPEGIALIGEDVLSGSKIRWTFPSSLKEIYCIIRNSDIVVADLSHTQLKEIGTLGSYNFLLNNCQNLETVLLPQSLQKVGSLMSNCNSVCSVVFPYGVDSIGCLSAPKNMVIPESVTSFTECYGARTVVYEGVTPPNGVGLLNNSDITLYVPAGSLQQFVSQSVLIGRVKYKFTGIAHEMVDLPNVNIYADDNEATILGCSASSGRVIIPPVVTGGSGEVPVTKFSEYAFMGNVSLRYVDVPAVDNVGEKTFAYCVNLDSVRVHWGEPKMISESVFRGIDLSRLTLIVPDGKASDYYVADVWKQFGNIVEESEAGFSGIETIDAKSSGVIYDMSGRSTDGKQSGVNILNGKKFLVK